MEEKGLLRREPPGRFLEEENGFLVKRMPMIYSEKVLLHHTSEIPRKRYRLPSGSLPSHGRMIHFP